MVKTNYLLLGLFAAAVAPATARAATTQNFAGGGTPYASSTCEGTIGPAVQGSGGPTGGAYMRLTGQTTFSSTSIAFQRSDPGAFSQMQIQFDFRMTPPSPANRADGFGVALLNTVSYDNSGGRCVGSEEPNLAGSFAVGFDIYQSAGEPNNNHISIHHANSLRNTLTSPIDLGSGQWARARIVVRPGGAFSDVSIYLTPSGGGEIAVVTNQAVAGLNPYESRVYFAARTGGQVASHDIANVSVTYTADPAVVGSWTGIKNVPTIPIHSVMLPNKKILFWDRANPPGDIIPRLWNPADETTSSTPNPVLELFCSGQTLDAQGRALMFGGHNVNDGYGLNTGFAYDHLTNSYRQLPNMNAGRWYPTQTPMGNGDVLVVSGSVTPGAMNQTPQVWQDKTQTWRTLTGANRNMAYYPMMFLAPNGQVFNAGPNADTKFLNTSGTGAWGATITNTGGSHDYGAATIIDGKVTVFGGGYTTNIVEQIDLNLGSPTWAGKAAMAYARRQHNGVILADGNVLITGGSKTPQFNDNAGAILASEIYNPGGNSWSMGAGMAVSRIYHSETVLLADGRVASLGGGHPAADNGGGNNFNLEIYSPPYLFKGARPTITSAPASGANGQTFFVATPDGATITKVNLIRLNGVTHSFDMNQRLNTLPFSVVGGGLNVTLPSNANVTPPGHYWLFLVKNTGVPSIGHMISVQRAYDQSTAADGIISIEVERFHDNLVQGGHQWQRTATSGASGGGAQQSMPNNGANVNTGFAAGSPRMDFWVNFTKTGVHHVWARGQGPNGDADSYHMGIDGVENTTADRISNFGTGWTWGKTTMDGPVATVNVATLGLHRVSVWMREDGLILDKLVLTVNANYTPTGNGPAESAPY